MKKASAARCRKCSAESAAGTAETAVVNGFRTLQLLRTILVYGMELLHYCLANHYL